MIKIETLYVVLTVENDRETIAALNMSGGLSMQAVSSEKRIITMAYAQLKEACPAAHFEIREYRPYEKSNT